MNKNKIYTDKDISFDLLRNKVVGIIGYGNQGRAQALNLKNSGVSVLIGLREESSTRIKAEKDGFSNIMSINQLVKKSDIICFMIPDEEIPGVFKYIEKYISPKQVLLFAHGYCVHFKKINIPEFVDVIMVAPSGAGKMVRQKYLDNQGVPNLIAIHQDYTKTAFKIALSYSKNIGGTKVGAFISTFEEETVSDIFGEQAILTGGIPFLIKSSFDTLVEEGYSPIVAWFVCYYEVKSIVDLFHENGFEFLNNSISNLAEYGGLTKGEFLIDDQVKLKMKEMLQEIKNGNFVSEWENEKNTGSLLLNQKRDKIKKSQIEEMNQKMLKILFKK